MSTRWDGDARGHGVADARQLVPGAEELVEAFSEPLWIAEQPEIHVQPHVERWCRRDGRIALTHARTDSSGAYVIDVVWRGESGGVGQARAAVFAMIGSFAESATYVRQRQVRSDPDDSTTVLRFEVGTGELGDAGFDPHGHALMINVSGVLRRSPSTD